MTVAGLVAPAAAPATMNMIPWPTMRPALARPNAWARRAFGTRATKAALAGIW
jgi:hypothetical protein